ncbi:MAG: diguanylate cyclase [Lachnospiraceae bacterium]|nr:diguanylate cyclase [Lachnospiraceae bacterium]
MQPEIFENVCCQTLIDTLPLPFFVTDSEMKVIFANKAGIEFTNKDEDALIGQPLNIVGVDNSDNYNIKHFKESVNDITDISSKSGRFRLYTSKLVDVKGEHIGFNCLVIDKSEVLQKEKQIKLKDERVRLTKPFHKCGIFEYDSYEKSWRRDIASNDTFFFLADVTFNMPESIISAGYIHPRSIEDMRNIFKLLDDGEPFVETEIAMVISQDSGINDVAWYRITCTNIFDENENLIKAIGISQDITKQKENALIAEKERYALIEEINKDPLTGLFNRRYMIDKIETFLKNRPNNYGGALLMVDVDSFRLVNNCFGHKEGDELLKKIADVMRENFREGDWLCRAGADEFLVFLSVEDDNVVREKAQMICDKSNGLGKSFIHEKIPNDTVGVSIGIALFSEKKVDFHELYRYADKALFAAKSRGKNNFAVYGEF